MRACLSILVVGFSISSAVGQSVFDPDLRVDLYVKGLNSPTGVAFLNESGDALITQKNDGRVMLVRDRKVVGTALDLPVANDSEQGLLSIALSPNFASDKAVYLYHTAASRDGGTPIANRISRYTWNGNSLVFNKTVMDLPGGPGPNHDGGKITFGPKGKLFAVVGDLNRSERTANFENSSAVNRVSSIIRIQPNGKGISTNPFAAGGRTAVDDIFAYGVRNSFGLAVDPVTGDLWDTENGPGRMDEINRVTPGFNSGWRDIMGPTSRNGGSTGNLVSLGGRAAYSDPEFAWEDPVAPTDLHFFTGSRLGEEYRNDLFVGDVNTGSIFHFDLASDRKSLALSGGLADGVADNSGNLLAEQESILFGEDFGIVTDLLNGPGGLFALSLTKGRLYRIRENPNSLTALPAELSLRSMTLLPEPGFVIMPLVGLIYAIRRPLRASSASHQRSSR